MAKSGIEKTEYIEITQTASETLNAEELDIIAACVLKGSDEVIHINPELNSVEVDDTINIKDYVSSAYGAPIRNVVDNTMSELSGTINVTYGYADVAMAIMANKPRLQINVEEDCIRFRDWKVVKMLAQNYPSVFVGGCVRKSAVANITVNTKTDFEGVEYFNETYYFKGLSGDRSGLTNDSLKEFTISTVDKSLGLRIFNGLKSLEKINNFENNTKITNFSAGALNGCSNLKFSKLPPNIVCSGFGLYGCSSITITELPDGISSLAIQAFYNCSSIKTFKMPPLVVEVPAQSFYNCSSLKSIDLNNVQNLTGSAIFYGCSSLEDVYMYKVINADGMISANGAFNTPNIRLHVNDFSSFVNIQKNYAICAALFSLYDKDGNELKNVVDNSLTKIPKYALKYWNGETLEIPNVEEIGAYAFQNCTQLTKLKINNLKIIGTFAFNGCTNLDFTAFDFTKLESIGDTNMNFRTTPPQKLIVNGGVKIGSSAFFAASDVSANVTIQMILFLNNSEKNTTFGAWTCSRIGSITLDICDHVISMGMLCFYYVKHQYVIFRNTDIVMPYTTYLFSPSVYYFVPAHMVDLYKNATGWSGNASKFKAIGGAEWISAYGSADEYADYPDEHKPLPLSSIGVEYDATDKRLYVNWNNHKVVHTNERGYNLSVVSPASGVTIDSDHVVDYGSYSGDITVRVTSTYNSSITNTLTFTV